jgi:hypothetical protein
MTVWHWEGTVQALTSIRHTGESLGTVQYLRRERFLTPNGTKDIPVVSGNAVRGALRRHSADLTWNLLGEPKMLLGAAHALWSGGTLVRAKGEPLAGARLAELRARVPHVALFGAAAGGRILDGALAVGKLVPICTDTAHIIPEQFHPASMPTLWDLLQVEEYSRTGQAPRISSTIDPSADAEPDTRFRFGTETFIAGTSFYTWWQLVHPTVETASYMALLIDQWAPVATVGGGIRAGHGRIALNLNVHPELPAAGWVPSEDRARTLETLSWLD